MNTVLAECVTQETWQQDAVVGATLVLGVAVIFFGIWALTR